MDEERDYQIHHFLAVRSSYELDRLAPFRVDRTHTPDIVVRPYRRGEPKGERLGDYVWESDNRLTLDLGSRIRASLKRTEERFELSYTRQFFRVGDPEELLQAMVTQALPSAGPHLVNAAGVRDSDGRGILLFGSPQSGKTTTAVQLARREGWALLSDEVVFLDEGTVYSFPRPVRFRRHSPLYDEEMSTVRQFLNDRYRSAVPDGTRRVLKHLKHRIPGVNVGGTVREAEELASTTDRADLSVCVFLHPTTSERELRELGVRDAASSASLLSNWISDHPFVNRYAYLDGAVGYEIPAVNRSKMAQALGACDSYAVRAPRDEFTPLLAERLNN